MNTNAFTHDPIVSDLVSRILFKENGKTGKLLLFLLMLAAVTAYACWPRYDILKQTYTNCMDSSGNSFGCEVFLFLKTPRSAESNITVKQGYVWLDEQTAAGSPEGSRKYEVTKLTAVTEYEQVEGILSDQHVFTAYSNYETLDLYDPEGNLWLTVSK